MYKTLLIDADSVHADRVIDRLARQELRVELVSDFARAESVLRSPASSFELVIVNVSDRAQAWIPILGNLQRACRESGRPSLPLFLCVSTRRREPLFELEIERKGARYVFER
jgi:hypothetical protein